MGSRFFLIGLSIPTLHIKRLGKGQAKMSRHGPTNCSQETAWGMNQQVLLGKKRALGEGVPRATEETQP